MKPVIKEEKGTKYIYPAETQKQGPVKMKLQPQSSQKICWGEISPF